MWLRAFGCSARWTLHNRAEEDDGDYDVGDDDGHDDDDGCDNDNDHDDGDRRGDDNDEKYHLSIIYHLTVSKLIMMTIPIMIMIISISIFDLSIVGSRCRTLSNSPFIFGH